MAIRLPEEVTLRVVSLTSEHAAMFVARTHKTSRFLLNIQTFLENPGCQENHQFILVIASNRSLE